MYFTINTLLVENTLHHTLQYFTILTKTGEIGKNQKLARVLSLHRFLAFGPKKGIFSLKYFTAVSTALE
jgi:hypothetical protein